MKILWKCWKCRCDFVHFGCIQCLKVTILPSSSLANFMQERDRSYTPARSIVCLSQIWVQADIQLCKIVLHAPDELFFISIRPRSSYCRQKSSPTIILWGEALATWPNKYNRFKWVMSSDKKILAWIRTSWCKLQAFLNSVPFLQQCSKVLTERNAFPTAKNILLFFIVKFSF